ESLAAKPGIRTEPAQRNIFDGLIDLDLMDADRTSTVFAQDLLCHFLALRRAHANPQHDAALFASVLTGDRRTRAVPVARFRRMSFSPMSIGRNGMSRNLHDRLFVNADGH